MKDRLFSKIDELNVEYVKIWEDICNIESPWSFKEGVDAVGEYFIRYANERGWKVEVFEQERAGNVVILTMNPEVDAAPIALSGHMDTVHPIGLFGSPATRRDGDKLHGPGAMDCKGGIVAGFLAMQALEENGYKDRPVMMLLQSNEEIGSGKNNKEPIRCICEKAKYAVAFLTPEGHEGYFAGKACRVRKGIAGFVCRVHGISAHASYCAREGASAIAEAAKKIVELEKFKNDSGITFNVGKINGGTVRNTVPDLCEFELDCRYVKNEDLDEIKRIVEAVADHTYIQGCTCEAELINWRHPMELCERNIDLFNKANAAFVENGLSPLEIGFKNGGSDAADVTAFGIPCIDSLGVGGERAHSTEEYGVISSLPESAKRIAAIACSI
jgi:glutamate carboxypeptidase